MTKFRKNSQYRKNYASTLFSPSTMRISSLCGRQTIGTAPPFTAPLFTHTLSGQSAKATLTEPFSIFTMFTPSSHSTVNSASTDSGAFLIRTWPGLAFTLKFPSRSVTPRMLCGQMRPAPMGRPGAKTTIPAAAAKSSAISPTSTFLFIFHP